MRRRSSRACPLTRLGHEPDAQAEACALPRNETHECAGDLPKQADTSAWEAQQRDAPSFARERLEITECLGRFEHREGVGFIRHGEIFLWLRGHDEEHAVVRSTLVQLARGVQVPRPVSRSGGTPGLGGDRRAEGVQCVLPVGVVGREVGEQAEVVVRA